MLPKMVPREKKKDLIPIVSILRKIAWFCPIEYPSTKRSINITICVSQFATRKTASYLFRNKPITTPTDKITMTAIKNLFYIVFNSSKKYFLFSSSRILSPAERAREMYLFFSSSFPRTE